MCVCVRVCVYLYIHTYINTYIGIPSDRFPAASQLVAHLSQKAGIYKDTDTCM